MSRADTWPAVLEDARRRLWHQAMGDSGRPLVHHCRELWDADQRAMLNDLHARLWEMHPEAMAQLPSALPARPGRGGRIPQDPPLALARHWLKVLVAELVKDAKASQAVDLDSISIDADRSTGLVAVEKRRPRSERKAPDVLLRNTGGNPRDVTHTCPEHCGVKGHPRRLMPGPRPREGTRAQRLWDYAQAHPDLHETLTPALVDSQPLPWWLTWLTCGAQQGKASGKRNHKRHGEKPCGVGLDDASLVKVGGLYATPGACYVPRLCDMCSSPLPWDAAPARKRHAPGTCPD